MQSLSLKGQELDEVNWDKTHSDILEKITHRAISDRLTDSMTKEAVVLLAYD